MSGTWKGADKPAGSHYQPGVGNYKNLTDCPKCKYGTLKNEGEAKMKCIDCGDEFEIEYLKQIGVLPKK